MKRAFMFGMLATSIAMLAVACYVAAGGTKADGPEPRFVYTVALDPVSGGPQVLCVDLPTTDATGTTRIETIDGQVLYTRNIPLFIRRSAEKLNVEVLRQRLAAPPLQTQEAQGPLPAPNKG